MTNINNYNPVILLGAPRTGTKMLRELLKLHPDIDGVLYEQERIWTYGNKHRFMKSLNPADLNPRIIEYIRKHFIKQFKRSKSMVIVDKCVTNSLRIPYVRTIFPNSPIIHIVRDGRDSVCSIMDRWKSPFDYKYILKYKAFPIKELPFFLVRQGNWYLEKFLNKKEHVQAWGPQFDDTVELVKTLSLLEISAIQWQRCTEAALKGLEQMGDDNYYMVRYEDIINDPLVAMGNIFHFLNLKTDSYIESCLNGYIVSASLNRWKKCLTTGDLDILMPIIQETMKKLSYI